MSTRKSRWPVIVTVLATALVFGAQLRAEEDHLKGYKIKDLNQVAAPGAQIVTNQFGSESCELKKPQFFLVQSEKNGGDDPRGGPAGYFVCYKAKCTGTLPPVTAADSQFGVHNLESKKAKLLCLPVDADVCGDGDVDPGETCDGMGASPCPGDCLPDCTCAPQCPSSGGDLTACLAFSSSTTCSDCCQVAAACGSTCTGAATTQCSPASTADACAAAINTAGCATECCP